LNQLKCFGGDGVDDGTIVSDQSDVFLRRILVGRFVETQFVPNVDADDLIGDPTGCSSFIGRPLFKKRLPIAPVDREKGRPGEDTKPSATDVIDRVEILFSAKDFHDPQHQIGSVVRPLVFPKEI
jgi:hypothetical protein